MRAPQLALDYSAPYFTLKSKLGLTNSPKLDISASTGVFAGNVYLRLQCCCWCIPSDGPCCDVQERMALALTVSVCLTLLWSCLPRVRPATQATIDLDGQWQASALRQPASC